MRLTVKPAQIQPGKPNVFLNNGTVKAYYDANLKRYERITLLPDSILTDNHDENLWMAKNITELERMGYLKRVANGYKVIKPICGSPSGTVAIALGQDGSAKPNGYKEWKYVDGQVIKAI